MSNRAKRLRTQAEQCVRNGKELAFLAEAKMCPIGHRKGRLTQADLEAFNDYSAQECADGAIQLWNRADRLNAEADRLESYTSAESLADMAMAYA